MAYFLPSLATNMIFNLSRVLYVVLKQLINIVIDRYILLHEFGHQTPQYLVRYIRLEKYMISSTEICIFLHCFFIIIIVIFHRPCHHYAQQNRIMEIHCVAICVVSYRFTSNHEMQELGLHLVHSIASCWMMRRCMMASN